MERGGSSPCTSSSPAWRPVSSCSSRRPRRSRRPSTVDLRVEGREPHALRGPVTTDVRHVPLHRRARAAPVRRDSLGVGGTSAHAAFRRAAPPGRAAAELTPFALGGSWSDTSAIRRSPRSPARTSTSTPARALLGEYKNGQFAVRSAPAATRSPPATACCSPSPTAASRCSALSRPGDGPARPARVDGEGDRCRPTARAIAGASVGGRDHRTPTARRPWARSRSAAIRTCKATKPGTVRSNRLRVCVSDGSDGSCGSGTAADGTPPGRAGADDTVAPATTLAHHERQGVLARARRRGRCAATSARIRRACARSSCASRATTGKKCAFFSGGRERFRDPRVRARRVLHRSATAPTGRYLLPKRLGRGRYVLEADGDRRRLQPRADRARCASGCADAAAASSRSRCSSLAVPAPAGAASVELMVVGKTRVLREAGPVQPEGAVGAGRRPALRGRPARRRCRRSPARG